MPPALPGRAPNHCFCCQSPRLSRDWAVTSSFFAHRALRRPPEPVSLLHCTTCGTRYFDVSPTDIELGRLYDGYRDETYFWERHGFEPWYKRAVNDGLGGEGEMRARRARLASILTACDALAPLDAVLDHGGDRGQMLQDLNARLKAVYEISGIAPEAGVVSLGKAELTAQSWDLILCYHVLEHLPNPQAYLAELAALGAPETLYVFEVPDEGFRSFGATPKSWLSWLARHPSLFKLADFLSTALRVKLGVVPPLGFVALREHLSFFTAEGVSRLLANAGFSVIVTPIVPGSITLAARRT